MRSSVPSQLQSSKSSYTVERGGRSLGIARHWQPVLRMYISPFTTSRTFTVRLLPPRLPGRMSGSTWLHSSSVKSLGYRSLLRSYRARFSIVHIGNLSTTQAATLASQTLDPIQQVPEQALRPKAGPRHSPDEVQSLAAWRTSCSPPGNLTRSGLKTPEGVSLHAGWYDLYPAGPTDQDIWARAGGDVSRLKLSGTGRANWFAALRVLKLGGGGQNITRQSLLKAALNDF